VVAGTFLDKYKLLKLEQYVRMYFLTYKKKITYCTRMYLWNYLLRDTINILTIIHIKTFDIQ